MDNRTVLNLAHGSCLAKMVKTTTAWIEYLVLLNAGMIQDAETDMVNVMKFRLDIDQVTCVIISHTIMADIPWNPSSELN